MDRSGIVDEVLARTPWMAGRPVRPSPAGHPELFVDVVNLSFGEYLRGPCQVPRTVRSWTPSDHWAGSGAGGGLRRKPGHGEPGRTGRVGSRDPKDEQVGLVSVGALDPDGETAMYCNHGAGSRQRHRARLWSAALPDYTKVTWPDDDFAGAGQGRGPNLQAGIRRWSGTSFAAGWLSATIAAHLLDGAGPPLDDVTPDAASTRARAALKAARSTWRPGRRSVPPVSAMTATRTERLAEALERARAGDTSGLDDIVRELNPLLWHVARSQGVDRAEVADVVQHSWLELVRGSTGSAARRR